MKRITHPVFSFLVGCFCLLFTQLLIAQEPASSSAIEITGEVKSSKTIPFSAIKEMGVVPIGKLTITNHAGVFRKSYKNTKGVPLLELFREIEINAASPKELSRYYFVVSAKDQYLVVISWNELFNTEIGKSFFIVTEIDGKAMDQDPENILLLATRDIRTCRRHVKGVAKIEVRKIP